MSISRRSPAPQDDDRDSGIFLAGSDPAFLDPGALAFVLDQIPVGVFLVGGSRTVVWMNRSAGALIRTGEGIALRDGRLVATSHAETRALDQIVERATAAPSGGDALQVETIALSRPSGGALVAVVRPVEPIDERRVQGAARAVIFLSDPEHDLRASRDRLRSLFQLTPAESDLVALLTAGSSLSAAARRLAITNESARTYLKRVFAKTGTQRQAELVRLALAVATAGAGDA